MIIDLTHLSLGDLVVLGLLAVVLWMIGHLGRRLIDLGIYRMGWAARPARLHSWPTMAPLLTPVAVDTPSTPAPPAPEMVDDAPTEVSEPAPEPYPADLAPDLDEDETAPEPVGQHAPGPGRISVDVVTGYVKRSPRLDLTAHTVMLAAVGTVSRLDGVS